MLNVTYDRLNDPDVVVTSAHCHLPLFGRWCKLQITSYSVGGGTAITFGFQASDAKQEIAHNRRHASTNGMISLSRGCGGNFQQFDQTIDVPHLIGQLLDWSTLADGGTLAGRTVSSAILRRTESIIETVRQNVRNSLGTDAKEQALHRLNEYYGQYTYDIRSFLGEINWRLMLEGAGLDADAADVIEHALENNPIRVHRITSDEDNDIPLIANAELNRFDRTTLANIKATNLLKKVCGEKLGEQFEKTGKIIVSQFGYDFEIAPGQFVHVTDPNGKKARLCIHTINLSCNPIDEVCIAYLHIRNKFDEWMKIAAVHGAEKGFQRERVA